MKVEITEEEREFLERICARAEIFCMMNVFKKSVYLSPFDKDLKSITDIKMKFKKSIEKESE